MFSSFNQVLVTASRRRRPAKPSGVLGITHSTTTCCTNFYRCPQAHTAHSCVPQSFTVSPTRTMTQRRRSSRTNCMRGYIFLAKTNVSVREAPRHWNDRVSCEIPPSATTIPLKNIVLAVRFFAQFRREIN